jgi:surface protein
MSNLFYNCTLITELDLSNFDTSNVTTMSGMFNGCQSLTSLDVNHFVTDNVENMSSMFTGCSCDIVFTNKNTSKVKSVFAMFNIFSGQSIDLSGMTIRNSTNNDSFITVAQHLVDLIPPEDICVDIHITADSLSVESLMRIINNLAEVAKPQILEIGYNNISKLTDEQLAVAISKNWTIC